MLQEQVVQVVHNVQLENILIKVLEVVQNVLLEHTLVVQEVVVVLTVQQEHMLQELAIPDVLAAQLDNTHMVREIQVVKVVLVDIQVANAQVVVQKYHLVEAEVALQKALKLKHY